MKQSKDGFSLVEVIIAVAVLAILVLPILVYYTRASITTSDGKAVQKAEMAAQSVVEEIHACSSFDQIEQELAAVTGSAWTIESVEAQESRLTKLLTVDGIGYRAKVELNYDYTPADQDGNAIAAKYNGYQAPQLTEVYSPHSVVMEETDQMQTAVSNFYYADTSVTKSEIQAALERTLCLSLQKNGAYYRVCGYYEYEYKGNTYKAVIQDTKIEVSKLTDIYIFYNLYKASALQEKVRIDMDSTLLREDAEKLNVCFVCQETAVTKPVGYTFTFEGCTGNYTYAKYFSNGILSSSGVMVDSDLVKRKTKKRIAKVRVCIYREEETVFDENTKLADIETSKGE